MIPWEDNFGKLSKKQEELVIGSLLGDGRLECRSIANTARLRIHHADSQKEYLFWKFQQLKNLTNNYPRRHEYVDKRYQTKIVSWYFHTKTFVSLGKFYSLFYRKGKKILPKNIGTILTPLAMAIWIMDDGCLSDQTLILNTQSFSLDEQKHLQYVFKQRFGIEVGVHKDRKNFRLYFPKFSTKKMQNIILPFLFGPKFIPVETDSRKIGMR